MYGRQMFKFSKNVCVGGHFTLIKQLGSNDRTTEHQASRHDLLPSRGGDAAEIDAFFTVDFY